KSRYWYDKTGGWLDPTIAPVGRLWRRARRDRKLPDPEKLEEALALVGMDKLVLDPKARTVRLTRPGMKLDVGGTAKGYAAQAAIDVLRARGVDRALVAGAGDIVVSGPPPDAEGWTIGGATLEPSKAEPEIYLSLKDAAVSTSGDAERFVVIDGRRYSHIINPRTGRAIEDRASVTVVAPDGEAADVLETAAYMLGPEKGLELIDSIPGAAGVFTRETPEGIRRYESSRFKDPAQELDDEEEEGRGHDQEVDDLGEELAVGDLLAAKGPGPVLAPPMITPTARSITFPLKANFLNSSISDQAFSFGSSPEIPMSCPPEPG
ncbi:hypothetical protein HK102_010591, partial [Quaeritorhiza haematococci]